MLRPPLRPLVSGLLLSFALAGSAADPAAGTITMSNRTLEYAFPPAPVANASGVGGDYTCDDLNPCDIYELTIDLPADYTSTHPNGRIRISAATTSTASDIDLQLADADGNVLVEQRDNPPDQPSLVYQPLGGVEQLRVRVIPGSPHEGGSAVIELYEDNSLLAGCDGSGGTSGGTAHLSNAAARDLSRLPASTPYGAFIHFSSGTASEHRALLAARGLTLVTDYEQYARAVFARGTVAQVRALISEPSVLLIEDNAPLQFFGETSSWATRVRVAQEAVSGGPYTDAGGNILRGDGITAAVIDSGLNATHPDFEGRVLHNWKVSGDDDVSSAPPVDVGATNSDTSSGHGTHVAGIVLGGGQASTGTYPVAEAAPGIPGTFTGVAPLANIVAYGTGETLLVQTATSSFQHILDNYDETDPARIRVINNSYGDSAGSAYNPGSVRSCLIKALVQKGVTMVFAAGNGDTLNDGGDGSDDRTSSFCKDPTPGVICVANYDDGGTGALNNALNSSSSRGKIGEPKNYPDIAAPGSDITATCIQPEPGQSVCATGAETRWQPYYGTIGGTSMSSPHIAGAVALLLQARPTLTPAEIEDVLQDTARKMTFNGDYEADPQNPGGTINFGVGAGLLDLQAALDALGVSHPGLPETGGAEQVILDGDADPELVGAADVVKLTMQETDLDGLTGITYRLTVRDAADFGSSAELGYRVAQNTFGKHRVAGVNGTVEAVTAAPLGPDANAEALAVSRNGNVISFFVPYAKLASPPVGSPIHNIQVTVSDAGTLVEFAPSPADTSAEVAELQPMFGRAFTVLLETDASASSESACVAPGITLIEDGLNDYTLPAYSDPGMDIERVSVSESAGKGLIAFHIKMRNLETVPAQFQWPLDFVGADGLAYEVSAVSNAAGVITYRYRVGTNPYQPAHASSSYTPEGMINIVVPKSGVGADQPGGKLTQFLIRVTTASGGPTPDNAPDGLGPTGEYLLHDDEFCKAPASYSLFGGGLPLPMLVVLGLLGLWRRRAG